jgi:hypothetical protein
MTIEERKAQKAEEARLDSVIAESDAKIAKASDDVIRENARKAVHERQIAREVEGFRHSEQFLGATGGELVAAAVGVVAGVVILKALS